MNRTHPPLLLLIIDTRILWDRPPPCSTLCDNYTPQSRSRGFDDDIEDHKAIAAVALNRPFLAHALVQHHWGHEELVKAFVSAHLNAAAHNRGPQEAAMAGHNEASAAV